MATKRTNEQSSTEEYTKLVAKLEEAGVPFSVVPPACVPGLHLVSPGQLAQTTLTKYCASYIQRLAKLGEIESVEVAGRLLLPPSGVQQIIEREAKALAGELHAGPLPGHRRPLLPGQPEVWEYNLNLPPLRPAK